MKRLVKIAALVVAVYAVATKSGRERLKRARETYTEEVASGAKPIEAVGTAIAAFVGLADDGNIDTPGVYVEEVPLSDSSIEDVETSTESFVEPDHPEKP